MNRLTKSDRVNVIRCLVEGNSIRSTVRITGIAKNTVAKLLVDMGKACSEFQNEAFHDLPCKRLQLDEIWSFVYAKAKNVPADKMGEFGVGDVWTWTAICADTKLIPSWHVGTRDGDSARAFCDDLASRLTGRVQITSDGHHAYLEAVHGAFGYDVDYAMLVKIYGGVQEGERRYTPSECLGCRKRRVKGDPDARHVSTSFVERANLTMRMSMRRFTRLTNAFSKKIENHVAAVSLHFMYYNFCRIHQTLRSTPAMKAGVTDHLWSIEEMVELLEKNEVRPN